MIGAFTAQRARDHAHQARGKPRAHADRAPPRARPRRVDGSDPGRRRARPGSDRRCSPATRGPRPARCRRAPTPARAAGSPATAASMSSSTAAPPPDARRPGPDEHRALTDLGLPAAERAAARTRRRRVDDHVARPRPRSRPRRPAARRPTVDVAAHSDLARDVDDVGLADRRAAAMLGQPAEVRLVGDRDRRVRLEALRRGARRAARPPSRGSGPA